MNKLFINYELSLALKEIGYNEQDIAYYRLSFKEENAPFKLTELAYFRERYDNHNFRLEIHKSAGHEAICTAPTYQQAFNFFIEKKVIIYPEYIDCNSKPIYVIKWHNGICHNEFRSVNIITSIQKCISLVKETNSHR